MIARIAIFLIGLAASRRVFILEDTTEIEASPGEIIQIDSPHRNNTGNMWVIGRFPSSKIIPNEGRLGDRYSERTNEQGVLLQTWTITVIKGSPGEVLPMDFWYIKPHYAEQYYNDPEAYEAMHNVQVETRILNFKVIQREL